MSRIIKSDHLIINQPKILGFLARENATHGVVDDQYAVPASFQTEIREVDNVRIEAEEIIKETEEMVLDILDKARSEASGIITKAQDEAHEIKLQAASEAGRIREEARVLGYNEGLQQAAEEMEQIKKQTISECEKLINEARKQKETILRSTEGDIVRLALAVAEKIVEKEISQDNDIIVNLVQKALSMLGNVESFKLLVNPRDLDNLVEGQAGLTRPEQGINKTSLQPDMRIKPGGFILDSEVGSVDARLETRLQNVTDALMEEVAGRGGLDRV